MFIISFSKDLFTTRQNILNEIVNYFIMASVMYVIGISQVARSDGPVKEKTRAVFRQRTKVNLIQKRRHVLCVYRKGSIKTFRLCIVIKCT